VSSHDSRINTARIITVIITATACNHYSQGSTVVGSARCRPLLLHRVHQHQRHCGPGTIQRTTPGQCETSCAHLSDPAMSSTWSNPAHQIVVSKCMCCITELQNGTELLRHAAYYLRQVNEVNGVRQCVRSMCICLSVRTGGVARVT